MMIVINRRELLISRGEYNLTFFLDALDEFIPTFKVVVILIHLPLLGNLATMKIKMKNDKKEK